MKCKDDIFEKGNDRFVVCSFEISTKEVELVILYLTMFVRI
jgi:hypothetical protein